MAGVFLTSCSDILCSDTLASCLESLGSSLLDWVSLICDFSPGVAKTRSPQLYYSRAGLPKETSIVQVMLRLTLPTMSWTLPATKTLNIAGWDRQDLEPQLSEGGGEKRVSRSVWATWDPVWENRNKAKHKAEEEDTGMQMLGLYQFLPLDKAELGFTPIWRGLNDVLAVWSITILLVPLSSGVPPFVFCAHGGYC